MANKKIISLGRYGNSWLYATGIEWELNNAVIMKRKPPATIILLSGIVLLVSLATFIGVPLEAIEGNIGKSAYVLVTSSFLGIGAIALLCARRWGSMLLLSGWLFFLATTYIFPTAGMTSQLF